MSPIIVSPELDSHTRFLFKAERDRGICFDQVVANLADQKAIDKCARKLLADGNRPTRLTTAGPFTLLDVCMTDAHDVPIVEITEDSQQVLDRLLRAQSAYNLVKNKMFEIGDYFN